MDAGFIIACPKDEEVCTIAECIRLRWGAPRGARYRTPEYSTFLYNNNNNNNNDDDEDAGDVYDENNINDTDTVTIELTQIVTMYDELFSCLG